MGQSSSHLEVDVVFDAASSSNLLVLGLIVQSFTVATILSREHLWSDTKFVPLSHSVRVRVRVCVRACACAFVFCVVQMHGAAIGQKLTL